MESRFAPPPFTYNAGIPIGEGSFGMVYYGSLTQSGKPICVKICKNRKSNTIEREFDLLAKLRGKNSIIQTLGLPRHSSGLPMNIMQRLVGDLGRALNVLVKEKIAHRDIKPMNILYFKETGESGGRFLFKLCDFGGGRFVVSKSESFQTVVGTVPYMAPQMLSRHISGDHMSMNAEKTDLWSLGVTLYKCITGELPFVVKYMDSPFAAVELLHIIRDRPVNAIAHCNGEYRDDISSVHSSQREIAISLLSAAEMRPRIVFNVNKSKFYEVNPRMWPNDSWFNENVEIGFEEDARLCFLDGLSHEFWLLEQPPRYSIREATENFLIIWDYTRNVEPQQQMSTVEQHSNVEEIYAPLSTSESSSSVLRQITTLREHADNAFILEKTTAELASILGINDAENRKQAACCNNDDTMDKIGEYISALEDLDGMRKNSEDEEENKKQLVLTAQLIATEYVNQTTIIHKESQKLARLLMFLLPMENDQLPIHDVQPTVRKLSQIRVNPTPAPAAVRRFFSSINPKNCASFESESSKRSSLEDNASEALDKPKLATKSKSVI